MNKKKIIFILPQLNVGGVQKTFLNVQRVIDYDKYDVTLYLRKNRQELGNSIDKRIKVIANEDNNKYYRRPRAVFFQILIFLAGLLGLKTKKEKLDNRLKRLIIRYSMNFEYKKYFTQSEYDTAVAYVQGYPALLCGKYVNAKKKILFFHTSVDELHDENASVIDEFDCICALHDGQADMIKEWYPSAKDKVFIINNYVNYEGIIKKSREFSVPASEKKVICTCGRMTKVKGYDLACKTAKILKDNKIDFLWRFVGDGAERANIEQLVKDLGITDNIEFVGMQKNPYPYIASCDIYVQSSYEEAMPVVIIEAQILNKPVVSTDTLGGRSLIKNGETGVICKIDEKSAADEIIKLINDKNYCGKIIDNLKNIDRSRDFQKYKNQWNRLLER